MSCSSQINKLSKKKIPVTSSSKLLLCIILLFFNDPLPLKHTILKGNATSSRNILHIVFPWPLQIRRLFLSLLEVMRSFLPTLFSPAPYFFFSSIFILFLFLWTEQSNGVPVFWLRWIGCKGLKSNSQGQNNKRNKLKNKN